MTPTHQPLPECVRIQADLASTLSLIREDLKHREAWERQTHDFLFGKIGEPGYIEMQREAMQALAGEVFNLRQEQILAKVKLKEEDAQRTTRWIEKYRGTIQIIIVLLGAISTTISAIVIAKAAPTP